MKKIQRGALAGVGGWSYCHGSMRLPAEALRGSWCNLGIMDSVNKELEGKAIQLLANGCCLFVCFALLSVAGGLACLGYCVSHMQDAHYH